MFYNGVHTVALVNGSFSYIFRNWDVEPNEIAKNSNQDCATMGIDNTFLDNACSGDKAGAICEEISGMLSLQFYLNFWHSYYFNFNYKLLSFSDLPPPPTTRRHHRHYTYIPHHLCQNPLSLSLGLTLQSV